MDFERADREFVMRGYKHNRRQRIEIEGGDHAKSIQAGHLDVKEYKGWVVLPDPLDCVSARDGVGEYFDIRLALEKSPDLEPGRPLVVHDEGPYPGHPESLLE